MFGKLVKYEWTAMMRSMVPIYLAVVALTLVNTVVFHLLLPDENPIFNSFFILQMTPYLIMTIYILMLGIMAAFTVIMIIQRFYKGLLKDEGYLMFTLPVPVWQLIFSKAVVSVLVGICSAIVAILSIGICVGEVSFLTGLVELIGELIRMVALAYAEEPMASFHATLFFTELGLAALISCFEAIYHLYLAMAIGHQGRNHRIALSVGAYVGLNVAVSVIGLSFIQLLGGFFTVLGDMSLMGFGNLHLFGGLLLLFTVLKTIAMAVGTGVLLDSHLNLE